MGKKIYEKQDLFGKTYWEDEDGNKFYEREGLLGGKYYEDQHGNKTYEREGLFGNKYYEDQHGNKAAERTGLFGNKYYEDQRGNKTSQEETLFGDRYLETDGNGPFVPSSMDRDDEEEPDRPRPAATRSSSRSAAQSGSHFLGFLDDFGVFGLAFAIFLLVVFIIIGIPTAGGVLVSKIADGRWLSKTQNKWLWRCAALPPIFLVGFLFTSELVGMAFWGISCLSPKSEMCAGYMRSPFKTFSGLHAKIVYLVGGHPDSTGPQKVPTAPGASAPADTDTGKFTAPIDNGPSTQIDVPYGEFPRPGTLTAEQADARINFRDRPDVNSPSRGFGAVNQAVELLEAAQDKDGYTWYRVRFADTGTEGWIRGDFVVVAPELSPTTTAADGAEAIAWQPIPGTYTDFTGDHTYIGSNTLIKSADQENVIDFDVRFDGMEYRYRANCATQEVQILASSDGLAQAEMGPVDSTSPLYLIWEYACTSAREMP